MIAGTHPWLRNFAALLICAGLYLGFVSAQEDTKENKNPPQELWKLPSPLEKNKAPASVEELREIEKHVQKVLKKVMPSIVGVMVGVGQGSGVIVREDGTILTAGHVSGTPHQDATVVLNGGKNKGDIVKGTTLGKNGGIDSGMMKISKEGKYPFLEMGKSADLKVGQWVIAIGHPGGVRPNRGLVVRVGRILFVDAFVIQTDCTLVGGDSGGPLFDMQGRVIGIHSRIGDKRISENMHVPIDTFRKTWVKLAKGDSIGDAVLALGGKIVFEKKDSLNKKDPTEPSPGDAAKQSHRKIYTVGLKAGHAYTIDLVGGDRTGEKLDPFLRVENPEGKEVAQDDDGGGSPHARIVYLARTDGDYKIVATSFDGNQTGAFTLTIRDAEFRTGKVKIQLQINALLVDDKGAALPKKDVTFVWDQGKKTVKSDADGYVRFPLNKDKGKKLILDLPKGVSAAFGLSDQHRNNMPFGQGPNDPSIEKVKSAGGPIVKTFDGALSKTNPFDLERDMCYRLVHEFKMTAGKTYTFDLVSEEFDAYLRIEHDEKGKIAEDDDSAGFMNSRIVFTPEKADTYRLVVTTCDPGQLGTYRLSIRETDAKPANPKKDAK